LGRCTALATARPTFNLPDLRGRITAGYAASGGHADVSTLGLTDGTALASRRAKHKHAVVQPSISTPSITVTDPGHAHSWQANNGPGGAIWSVAWTRADSVSAADANTPVRSATTGITGALASTPVASGGTVGPQTGAEPTDTPAYLVVNHIIKTRACGLSIFWLGLQATSRDRLLRESGPG
jgi:microcystin-dependent protein